MDAFTQGSAVLTPDLLAAEVQDRWAVFADAALEAGARAVYAFPLQMGAISPEFWTCTPKSRAGWTRRRCPTRWLSPTPPLWSCSTPG